MDGIPAITGAVRGAEHRRRDGRMPEGSRRWIAAIAQQYMDVLSEQPRRDEKHRGLCGARCAAKHRVRCLAFLVTFWAMPTSVRHVLQQDQLVIVGRLRVDEFAIGKQLKQWNSLERRDTKDL